MFLVACSAGSKYIVTPEGTSTSLEQTNLPALPTFLLASTYGIVGAPLLSVDKRSLPLARALLYSRSRRTIWKKKNSCWYVKMIPPNSGC